MGTQLSSGWARWDVDSYLDTAAFLDTAASPEDKQILQVKKASLVRCGKAQFAGEKVFPRLVS